MLRDRRTKLAWIGYLAWLALLALNGCAPQLDESKTAAQSVGQKPSIAKQGTAQSAGATQDDDADAAPVIDAESVNELGQVVLQGDEIAEPADDTTTAGTTNGDVTNTSALALQIADTEAVPTDATAVQVVAATVSGNSGPEPAEDKSPLNVAAADEQLPDEANVASDAERNQKIAEDWPKPQVVLFVSGQQHGYMEPCGCTGLDQQKGGLIRRDTLLSGLRDRGWNVVPVDVGNQVRRIGRQPEMKFQTTVKAFEKMDYQAVAFGVDDLKLSSVEVLQATSANDPAQGMFISANVVVLDPSFYADSKIVEVGGRKIGFTAVLAADFKKDIQSSDIEILDPIESLKPVVAKLQAAGCDFIVLLAHASMQDSAEYAQAVEGIDLVVTAGGFGEPTLHPESIPGTKTVMVQVGVKGMYGGIVGLFDDEVTPLRYQKIAISSQFKDSTRMLADFAEYQKRLENAGFSKLGVNPIPHPSGRKFVGSETCGDCHTTAFEIWEGTPHHHATESIVNPPNDRGGIQRHFDPECVSCHVTGWDAQGYYPFESGYASLADSELLLGSGCENCHGPGSQHVAAEKGDIEADNDLLIQLRQQMVLPLARARDRCLDCHDLDNSPDFHKEGAFDQYWERVKHYGKD